MGRPRKQPRRIVTFNLNLPLAEAIDDLPVKNRSEWANKALKEVLENRLETSKAAIEEKEFEAVEEAIKSLSSNERRLGAMLLSAIQRRGIPDFDDDRTQTFGGDLDFEDQMTLFDLLGEALGLKESVR